MQKAALITGNSSGLGHALTDAYLKHGWRVYGLSRRGCQGLKGALHDIQCGLDNHAHIKPALEKLLGELRHLDLVVLNAGVLGEIRDIQTTPLDAIQQLMDINVWANKLILDWLLHRPISVGQVIAISSGAAVNGSRGWAGYALSKATFMMLTRLYAVECPNTHFISLAPGLIDTAMQDYLCDEGRLSAGEFPSLARLRQARGTKDMPTAEQAASNIIQLLPRLRQYESGAFVDIRNL